MKSRFKALAALVFWSSALFGSFNLVQADESGRWTCKTAPIWNGRTSSERFTDGDSWDSAHGKAVLLCQTSGYADYCVSKIVCWQD